MTMTSRITATLLVFLLAGCSTIPDRAYHTLAQDAPPAYGIAPDTTCADLGACFEAPVTISFIELNDSGILHDRQQLANALDLIKGRGEQDIYIFLHGWRNNAGPNNLNVKEFRKFLRTANNRQAHVSPDRRRKTTGIYIGWRGDQNMLGGLAGDLFTIGERKRIGDTSIAYGTASLLDDITRETRTMEEDTRIIAIGHSLGGSALTQAVGKLLNYNRTPLEDISLIFILNGALTTDNFKAADLDRLGELKNQGTLPKMIFMQTNNDIAVKWGLLTAENRAIGFSGYERDYHLNALCSLEGSNRCPPPEPNGENLEYHKAGLLIPSTGYYFYSKDMERYDKQGVEDSLKKPHWVVKVDDSIMQAHGNIFNTHLAATINHFLEFDGKLRDQRGHPFGHHWIYLDKDTAGSCNICFKPSP